MCPRWRKFRKRHLEEKVEETFRQLNLGDVPVGQDPVGSAEDCVKSSFHLSQ